MSDHLRRLQSSAPSTSPAVEHVRIGGLRPRFFPYFSSRFLVVCPCDVTSAKPITESDCASVPGQAQVRSCNIIEVITLPRPHACQMSMRREPHPVRPIRCERNDDIDAQNWQAYHGRATTIPNGDAAGGTGFAPVRKTVDAVALAQTRRFARSFAPWRDSPHASASSWN
jgi:hypothetical protein